MDNAHTSGRCAPHRSPLFVAAVLAAACLALTATIAGCSSEGRSAARRSCATADDCPSGACVDGFCLDPDDSGASDGAAGDAGPAGGPDSGPVVGMDAGPVVTMDAGPGDAGVRLDTDSDGDGITDYQEGRFEAGGPPDTDGDGTPDYLDDDSDGDGVSDAIEAGDARLDSPPIDTDFDGIPDFRDLDSDANGVSDAVEGADDVDGDGRPDLRDRDNDDDGIDDVAEIGSDPAAPLDSDGDGTPDYEDVDSDGDTITDLFESIVDTDADLVPDFRDTDTDGDGYSDAVEAGDTDLMTPPVDTDGDTIPDFRDPDSDGDGLADSVERARGTSRTLADTDGDGASDLVEVGAGTDPLDGTDSPRARGDFVFVEPYMMPPSPTRDTLEFTTDLQKADVYFLVDTTGSMGGEITNLRTSLSGTIIPAVRARIPDAWFGVGGFEDYPVAPYGGTLVGIDRPYYQEQVMTTSTTSAQAAVNRLATRWGNDYPESHIPGLYAMATRSTLAYGPSAPGCAAGRLAFPCFRPDAVPVVVVITDAIAHNYPGGGNYSGISPIPPTYAATTAALNAINARVVGVNSGASDAHDMLLDFARQTGTLDASGSPAPFVNDISAAGTGLGTAVVDAIVNASRIPIEVSARANDIVDPGETVDAVAAFLDHLETRGTAAPGLTCTMGLSAYDRPGIDSDAFNDTFRRVLPGSPVCFDIVPKTNATVMPTLAPQIFRAQIDVLGDGFTPLDDRIIFFLVPPRIPDPNER